MKKYQSLVQYLTSHFLAFNVSPIPRMKNASADFLVNVSFKLIPHEEFSPEQFSTKMIFCPSILDNVKISWFFNDDANIINFLTFEETYDEQIIDKDSHDKELNKSYDENRPENAFPKFVVKLEYLYDLK